MSMINSLSSYHMSPNPIFKCSIKSDPRLHAELKNIIDDPACYVILTFQAVKNELSCFFVRRASSFYSENYWNGWITHILYAYSAYLLH